MDIVKLDIIVEILFFGQTENSSLNTKFLEPQKIKNTHLIKNFNCSLWLVMIEFFM